MVMTHSAVRILEIVVEVVALLGSISSSVYYLMCLWSARAFLRARDAGESATPARAAHLRGTQVHATHAGTTQDLPPVSILKPLKGVDPEIYECLRSHCVQDSPEYEIIFGVSDANDPAVASVRKLQQEFPARKIELIVCGEKLGANVKVSNLVQMVRSARHEHLIVNDSDIRVEPDYLRRVMMPLQDSGTGMVTCLYRGVPQASLGSRLESLGISTDFSAGLLVARQLEGGLHFGLGSTLAFRRSELGRIGGFEAIVDYLADDYELGRRIAALGLEVRLSEVVVETHLPAYDLNEFWSHQTRWARGIRDARYAGYVGLISTFGFFWALVLLLAARAAPWAWFVCGAVVILRLAAAWAVGHSILQDRNLFRNLWLLPARDLVAVAVWVASFAGHTVTWRGERFELNNGRLRRADAG